MNIWWQFNLANQSFMSDWRILYWRMLLYLHALGNKKENLAEFNLADFCNSPNHQNKFYAKFSSYTVLSYTDFYLYVYMCMWNFEQSWPFSYVPTYMHICVTRNTILKYLSTCVNPEFKILSFLPIYIFMIMFILCYISHLHISVPF